MASGGIFYEPLTETAIPNEAETQRKVLEVQQQPLITDQSTIQKDGNGLHSLIGNPGQPLQDQLTTGSLKTLARKQNILKTL